MKIKYSALVSGASGKLNGSVAANNRYGAYFRNKGIVTNVQSATQMAVRSVFGAISKMWRQLTDGEREAWKNYSKEHPYNDIFGDSRILQGSSFFQKVNMNLHKANLPLLESPLAPAPLGALVEVGVAGTAAANELTALSALARFDEVPTANTLLAIYATPAMSAGRSFVKNDFRLIEVHSFTPATEDVTADILDSYEEVFGTSISEGQVIHVLVAALDSVSGLQGPAIRARQRINF